MGKYTTKNRPMRVPDSKIHPKMYDEQLDLKEKDKFLNYLDGHDREPKFVEKSINDELMECSLHNITREALHNSK